MVEKKPARFSSVASWYEGNYCCMRCRSGDNEELKLLPCHAKIREFANDKSDRPITHKDFMKLVREELRICDPKNFKEPKAIDCPLCKALGVSQRKW